MFTIIKQKIKLLVNQHDLSVSNVEYMAPGVYFSTLPHEGL